MQTPAQLPFMKSLLLSLNHALQDLDNLPEGDWVTMKAELREMAEATQMRVDNTEIDRDLLEPPAEAWTRFDEDMQEAELERLFGQVPS